jgi:hypothetical protein
MDDASNTTPLAALIGEAEHDPTCRSALIGVVGECRDLLNRLLEPAGVNLDADQDARVCGRVLFQRFFAREPIRGQLIEQLIATWSGDRSAGVTADSTHQGAPVFARLAKPRTGVRTCVTPWCAAHGIRKTATGDVCFVLGWGGRESR